MKFSRLLILTLLLAGCSSGGSGGGEASVLFGRWLSFSPRFSGVIVSAPAGGGKGQTESEYIFRMRHILSLDQTGDDVMLTYEQILEGPQTLYHYNSDGSLSSRETGDISTTSAGFWSHLYEGTRGEGDNLTLTDEIGQQVQLTLLPGRLRMEFDNHDDLFHPFVRTFFDYTTGEAVTTPLVEHFAQDPYVIEVDRK